MEQPTLKLVGWCSDELYVKVAIDGRESWVPVDACEDGDVVWIRSRRYFVHTTRLTPCEVVKR